jgi:hypothetical protein
MILQRRFGLGGLRLKVNDPRLIVANPLVYVGPFILDFPYAQDAERVFEIFDHSKDSTTKLY